MVTGKQLMDYGVAKLGPTKRLEVELLLASVLGYNRAQLLAHDDDLVTAEQQAKYQQLINRRGEQEPLQYLLGTTNFMGMDFKVTPDVLIPRFDTEILVEKVLALLRGEMDTKRVLDLCTGSGAIAISVAKLVANSDVWASDLSPAAIQVATENSTANHAKVNFKQGSLFKPFVAEFDHYFNVIASNPPYITSDEFKALPQEVQQEPTMALWGGDDGLKFYRDIAMESPNYLQDEGYLVFEIGFAQGQAVKGIMEDVGFQKVEIINDWQNHHRVVFGQYRH